MSFGLSISDVLLAIDCCKWVVDNFFDKNNSPGKGFQAFTSDSPRKHCTLEFGLYANYFSLKTDQIYHNLEKDVKLLESRFRRLVQALEGALNHYGPSDLEAVDLMRDLKTLVGDFQHTIDKTKAIILQYVTLKRNHFDVISAVSWAALGREKAEALRREIQFHSQKIYFISDPVQIKLISILHEKVDEISDRMQRDSSATIPLPVLPQWLEMRLSEVVYENPPQRFRHLNQIPLKEGFDALYSHFQESTFAFSNPEIAPQTPEQYLNLLKSQWLLQTLRAGEEFHRARIGSLYPRTLAQIEQRILKQYQRKDVIVFNENVLQNLNPTAFLVWPLAPEIEVRLPTDPDKGEEMILKLSLSTSSGNETDELVIFRTGILTLRIARRFMDRFGRPNFDNDRFNIHHDKFIPFYSVTQDQSARSHRMGRYLSTSSIGIHRANETGTVDYEIRGEVDISKFQRAITGYQVWFSKVANWAINYSRNPPQGRSCVQIWHHKPLVAEVSLNSPISSPANSVRSPGSQLPVTSDAVLSRLLHRRNTTDISLKPHSETSSTMYFETPPNPVVMVFARQEATYSYFHIELTFGMQLVPTSCECSTNSGKCHRAFIEKRYKGSSEKDFLIRKLTVKNGRLNEWNIAVFGQPRHPLFDDKRVVEQIDTTKFLQLDFDSVEDRKEFTERFNQALKLPDKAEKEMQKLHEDVSFMSDNMGKLTKGKKLAKTQSRKLSTINGIRETI